MRAPAPADGMQVCGQCDVPYGPADFTGHLGQPVKTCRSCRRKDAERKRGGKRRRDPFKDEPVRDSIAAALYKPVPPPDYLPCCGATLGDGHESACWARSIPPRQTMAVNGL